MSGDCSAAALRYSAHARAHRVIGVFGPVEGRKLKITFPRPSRASTVDFSRVGRASSVRVVHDIADLVHP